MIDYSIAEKSFLAKFEALLKKRKDDEEAKRRQLKAKFSPLELLNFGSTKKSAEPQKVAEQTAPAADSSTEPEGPKPDARERLKQALIRQQQGLPPVKSTAPAAPVLKAPSAAKYRQPGAPPTPAHDSAVVGAAAFPASPAHPTPVASVSSGAPTYSKPPSAAQSYSRPPPSASAPAYSRPPTSASASAYSRPPTAAYSRPPPAGGPSYSRPPQSAAKRPAPSQPGGLAGQATTKRPRPQ